MRGGRVLSRWSGPRGRLRTLSPESQLFELRAGLGAPPPLARGGRSIVPPARRHARRSRTFLTTAESYRSVFDLSGRVAVVTGGGGALGAEIGRGLAEFGARVVAADLDVGRAQKVAQGIESAVAEQVDVSDRASVGALVERVCGQFGRLDVLVNSAGIFRVGPAVEMSLEEWEAVLRVNLTGTFLMTQVAGRVMLGQQRGNVVNIASVSSTVGNPGYAAYAASKGGVAQLTKVLGVEWCRHGVNVNAIGPAFTETELTRPWMERLGGQSRVVERIPMGRLGEPRDIVGAAIFLASDAARFLVGQTLYVDGGRTL